MQKVKFKSLFVLTLLLCVNIVVGSLTAISDKNFYHLETPNWQIQSRAQDFLDLFLIVPTLMIGSFLALRGKTIGIQIWLGAMLYTIYTFLIYTFSVHFNDLFFLYCLSLGLAFYSTILFLYQLRVTPGDEHAFSTSHKIIAAYLIIIGVAFYGLWLSEVIGAVISGKIPQTIIDVGLTTNPVHVIDLSIFLPGIIITGILLWHRHPLGYLFTPALLTFFILMNLTIGFINWMMYKSGIAENNSLMWVMLFLAILSLGLLTWFNRPGLAKRNVIV